MASKMSERIVGSIQKVGFLFFFCWFVLVYFHNWNIRVFVAGTCLCKEYYMYPDDHTLSLHGVCDVLEQIKWSDGKLIPWCAQYMYPTQKKPLTQLHNGWHVFTMLICCIYYQTVTYVYGITHLQMILPRSSVAELQRILSDVRTDVNNWEDIVHNVVSKSMYDQKSEALLRDMLQQTYVLTHKIIIWKVCTI